MLREVTERGLVILMKDDQIRKKRREQDAILQAGARAFVVTNARITGTQVAQRFIVNRHRIAQRAQHPGPYIDGVYEHGLTQAVPDLAGAKIGRARWGTRQPKMGYAPCAQRSKAR